MLNIYQNLTEYFNEFLFKDLSKKGFLKEYAKVNQNIIVQASKQEFGDYQSNIPLVLANLYKKKPREIALDIVNSLEKDSRITDICEELEIAGPGFINIKLKKKIFIEQFSFNYECPRIGIPIAFEDNIKNNNNKIIIDFSSPNIAKEMHVGHLRSTIIGDCLARIFELRGYEVLRINHIGDWGTQFGMLIAHLKDLFPNAIKDIHNINLGDLVDFYKASKKRFDNEIEFQKKARHEVVKLQNGNKDSIRAWQLLCDQSRLEFKKIYEILDIKIQERGESFYNPFLKSIIKDLSLKNLLVEDQGAKCVFLEGMKNKEGKALPLIVQKKDGGFNYATTDLAAIRYRFSPSPNGDEAKKIIYVTDHGQADHFSSVFQVAKRAHWVPKDCILIHVPFGLVQGFDGKKLKTREGTTIKLKDLLDESIKKAKEDLIVRLKKENRKESQFFITHTSKVIGISSVKYADLSQNRTTNYQFSFAKMLNFTGNTAPYLLYTFVRISGINRKNKFKEFNQINVVYNTSEEWNLIKKLLKFDEIILSVENDLMPNKLCNYLFELCQIFNRFYDKSPILKAEKDIKSSRLKLCYMTQKTLKLGLDLLGIETLDRM